MNRLSNESWTYCKKKSVTAVRKYIRTELKYELPWYKYLEAQKDLRAQLKAIGMFADSERAFVDMMIDLGVHMFDGFVGFNSQEEQEFMSIVQGCLATEPWHFIAKQPSREAVFLTELHGEIKKHLAVKCVA